MPTSKTNGGALCLQAAGDATLSHDDLYSLAKTVAGPLQGTTQTIVVDDSLFGTQDVPGGWEWGDMFYDYGAPPTSAVLDENTVLLSVLPASDVGQPAVIKYNVR
jgi:D-alanyl-D-alanine carboxypeptidase/D-alanyl-D-alanine-endopeptidase (penicillin-binding protein 4)